MPVRRWTRSRGRPTRVLLVGAGHAHLHLLDRADRLRRAGFELTLVAPRSFHYSGLATAVAVGALPAGAATIDVAALARRHGVHHLDARALSADPHRRLVVLEDGGALTYDLVSFNVGSVTASAGLPHATSVRAVKPFNQLASFAAWLAGTRPDRRYRVSIVGGGPTGLELAGQIAARFGDRVTVSVFERADELGAGLPAGARERVTQLLEQRGVQLRRGAAVRAVEADHVLLDGSRHEHDGVVLATGLAPSHLAATTGLGDHRGIPVRATLQHVEHDDVYAVGDAARFTPRPLPKLGVHAVRQGRVLERSFLARRAGRPLPEYAPRRAALRILDLGGGTALATRGRWWAEGPAWRRLKLAIDRRWLARYR